MAKQDIKLGQTIIEQVKRADDNFNELYDNASDINDRFDTDEGIVSSLETQVLTIKSKYITKAVSDLENYYTKEETDDKLTQLNDKISSIPKFKISVVSSLPTTGISSTTIYLVPNSKNETNNIYTEYIYTDGKWEIIGTQTIDLSGYALKDEIPTSVDGLTGGSIEGDVTVEGKLFLGEGAQGHSLTGNDEGLYYGDELLVTENSLGSITWHSQKVLTNENLDNLLGLENVGWYYADNGHACTGLPSDVSELSFGLEVGVSGKLPMSYQKLIPARTEANSIKVDCEVYYRSTYVYRWLQGTSVNWTPWKKLATLEDMPMPGTGLPKMDGTASAGSESEYARVDHVHPTDTTRASKAVATKDADGLMSASDKTALDLMSKGGSNLCVRYVATISANDEKYEAITIDGVNYYGYPIGDHGIGYDIISVSNPAGLGIVYQEYRQGDANYILLSQKAEMTVVYSASVSEL